MTQQQAHTATGSARKGVSSFAPDDLYRCALCGLIGPADALCAPAPIRAK